jgi:hypothetical protein
MSRSGNHAIIDWLLAQVCGAYCFLNCAEPKTNPFHSARPLDDDCCHRTNIPAFSLARESAGHFACKDLLIYSYEDAYLGAVAHPRFEQHRETFLGASRRRLNVLILRDPFNLLASRIQSGLYDNRYIWGEKVVTHRMAIRIWKQHAREVLSPRRLTGPTVAILYNRWTDCPAYRLELLTRIGLPARCDNVQRVARVAGGSSFDGLLHDGAPERMPVHQRWRRFINQGSYRACFDAETLRLSEQIFGPSPAMDALAVTQPKDHTA